MILDAKLSRERGKRGSGARAGKATVGVKDSSWNQTLFPPGEKQQEKDVMLFIKIVEGSSLAISLRFH